MPKWICRRCYGNPCVVNNGENKPDRCMYSEGGLSAVWYEVKEEEPGPLRGPMIQRHKDGRPITFGDDDRCPDCGCLLVYTDCLGCRKDKDEITRLKKELKTAEYQQAGLHNMTVEQGKEIERLKADNASLTTEARFHDGRRQEANREIKRLEKELTQEQNWYAASSKNLDAANIKIERLKSEVCVHKITNAKLDQILAYLEQWEPAKKEKK